MPTTPTTPARHARTGPLAIVLAGVLLAACAEGAPLAPDRAAPVASRRGAARAAGGDAARTVATLRRATARYHDLDAAIADGFVFLHGCEVRGEERPVGILYVHMGRLTDGVIDPASPDALLYEPGRDGRPRLIAAELAVPYALWADGAPPTFLGATFQREDEFGVYGLHAWVWRENPNGMFAETNPRVSCGAE